MVVLGSANSSGSPSFSPSSIGVMISSFMIRLDEVDETALASLVLKGPLHVPQQHASVNLSRVLVFHEGFCQLEFMCVFEYIY